VILAQPLVVIREKVACAFTVLFINVQTGSPQHGTYGKSRIVEGLAFESYRNIVRLEIRSSEFGIELRRVRINPGLGVHDVTSIAVDRSP
jgi:hypothetical protein